MSEKDPKKRARSATIQIDAVEDALEILDHLGDEGAHVEGGQSLPPPLPRSGPPSRAPSHAPSHAPSQAPPEPRKPIVYVLGGLVAIAAAAAGIWVATTLMSDPPPAPAEDDGLLEIGPIEITPE